MRLILVVIAALLVGIVATLAVLEDPGYVLIARERWSAEMSLPVFALLALAGAAAVYLLLYFLLRLVRIPRDVARWRTQRIGRHGRGALDQGLVRLAEGNWAEAQASLLTSLRGGERPLLTYLGAAYASQGLGNLEKRDEYLAAAQRAAPQQHLAIGMTQANLQYLAHQPERALATLSELRRQAPRHQHVLKLLAQLYLELRDWAGLAELIDDLRRHEVMPAPDIDALELRAHRELLTLTLPSGSIEPLRQAWNAVPRRLQHDPEFVALYARHLIRQHEMNEAESLLRAAIEEAWDDRLIELYGLTRSDRPAEQLEAAEAWLETRPESTALLLALGRLSVLNGADQKAIGYLEKCVALNGPAEAYRELGMLLERLGEKERALACYRRGAELQIEASGSLPPTRPSTNVAFLPRQRAVH